MESIAIAKGIWDRAGFVAEQRPPESDPPAGPERRVELGHPGFLVHPVERRRGDRQVECRDGQVRVLERRDQDLGASARHRHEVLGKRGIGLHGDERIRSERQQVARSLTRSGAHLDDTRAR
jgi:hypothetical protein